MIYGTRLRYRMSKKIYIADFWSTQHGELAIEALKIMIDYATWYVLVPILDQDNF